MRVRPGLRAHGLALAAALALALPSLVAAQTVRVRSGEHAGFSRLVLVLPDPAPWRFGRTEAGYELRIDRPGLRFDVEGVFERIPRTRLDTIWTDPATGALALGIACPCHAIAFAAGPGVIAIDIRPGAAPPGSAFERALDAPMAAALPPLAGRALARPRARPAAAPTPAAWRSAEPTGLPPGAAIAAAAELRRDLAGAIAAAAARGLVTPSFPLVAAPAPQRSADPPPAAPPQHADEQGAPIAQIQIRPDADAAPGPLAADGQPCPPDDDFAFLAAEMSAPASALAAARRGVLDGRDRPDPAAARHLAETYLALGFGAEARAVLTAFPTPPGTAPRLAALAGAIDGNGDAGPLAGLEACDGAVALWALLAAGDAAPRAPVAAGAIARTFAALPPAMRRHIGPTLAARLLHRGAPAAAAAIRNALARDGATPAVAMRMVEAGLAAASGDPARAEDALRDAAASDPAATEATLATLALARLVELTVDRGGAPDAQTLTLLAAHARERAALDEGAVLALALARGLAAAGDYAGAFAAAPDGAAHRAVRALLAERGSDAALLVHGFPGGNPADETPPTRQALAARFVALGLPEPALAWLDGLPADAATDTIAAGAILQTGDARGALRRLSGAAGPQAAALRAAALAQTGDTAGAAAALQAAGDHEQAAAVLWRAQDWAALPLEAGPPGAAALRAPAPDLPAEPSLAATRALQADGAERRAALAALLGATAVAPADAPTLTAP